VTKYEFFGAVGVVVGVVVVVGVGVGHRRQLELAGVVVEQRHHILLLPRPRPRRVSRNLVPRKAEFLLLLLPLLPHQLVLSPCQL